MTYAVHAQLQSCLHHCYLQFLLLRIITQSSIDSILLNLKAIQPKQMQFAQIILTQNCH